jgi:hypothetical protein
VGLLLNPANPINEPIVPAIRLTAQTLRLELHPFGVREPEEFEGAFVAMAAKRVGAVVVIDDATLIANASAVARLALQQRLPSSGWRWARHPVDPTLSGPQVDCLDGAVHRAPPDRFKDSGRIDADNRERAGTPTPRPQSRSPSVAPLMPRHRYDAPTIWLIVRINP